MPRPRTPPSSADAAASPNLPCVSGGASFSLKAKPGSTVAVTACITRRGDKLTDEYVGWIIAMRSQRNLGPRRIQAELISLHALKLSTATIWKVLNRHGMSQLRSGRTPRLPKSYSRDVPGERVQMDTVKIAPGLFQFTAVDDCTRMRVLALYPGRTAQNAGRFLKEHVLEEFPFPVQRIQTDRGGEFFGTPRVGHRRGAPAARSLRIVRSVRAAELRALSPGWAGVGRSGAMPATSSVPSPRRRTQFGILNARRERCRTIG